MGGKLEFCLFVLPRQWDLPVVHGETKTDDLIIFAILNNLYCSKDNRRAKELTNSIWIDFDIADAGLAFTKMPKLQGCRGGSGNDVGWGFL